MPDRFRRYKFFPHTATLQMRKLLASEALHSQPNPPHLVRAITMTDFGAGMPAIHQETAQVVQRIRRMYGSIGSKETPSVTHLNQDEMKYEIK